MRDALQATKLPVSELPATILYNNLSLVQMNNHQGYELCFVECQ